MARIEPLLHVCLIDRRERLTDSSTSRSSDQYVPRLPARTIPVPVSVSLAAQAALAIPPRAARALPALDDHDGWRASIDEMNATLLETYFSDASGIDALVCDDERIDGVRVYVVTPSGVAPEATRRAYLYIHGGAHVFGGGECCRATGVAAATVAAVRTYAVDYRMPPDHPYPAAVDDCVAVYRALLRDHQPQEVVVGGISAGANLAAALILRARDEGLPLPAAAVLLTPYLTESGDTYNTNLGLDTNLIRRPTPFSALYAAGHDLADPHLSPLFGDYTQGFPPTFLQTGTRDMLLSDTVRMHRALRAAGVPTELHVFEAMPHAAFGNGAPEDAEVNAEVRRFVEAHWGPPPSEVRERTGQ